MSKKKTTIRFENLFLLWQFGQKVNSVSIEIRTAERLITCHCSEEDLRLLDRYRGAVLEYFEA